MAKIANVTGFTKVRCRMLSRGKLATIKDVALLAQVSAATVSRAFNSPDLVDEATRATIQAAAQKLKYQPFGVARSLRRRRSMVVGAVIQSLENAGHLAGMVEMSQALLAQNGYTMVLASSHFSDEQAVHGVRAMVRQGIDALMLINGHPDTGVFPVLREFGIPYVAAWTPIPGEPSQGFNHVRAMRDATRHLLELGHRDFATVIPFLKTNDRRRERLQAIDDVLAAHGVEPSKRFLIDDLGLGVLDGRRALSRVLDHAPDTTAVICANDNLAAGVIIECRSRGIAVPARMSVTGYNDLEIASAMEPSITTVRTRYELVARATVDYLLARMGGETPPRAPPLPTELVVRASTSAPPG